MDAVLHRYIVPQLARAFHSASRRVSRLLRDQPRHSAPADLTESPTRCHSVPAEPANATVLCNFRITVTDPTASNAAGDARVARQLRQVLQLCLVAQDNQDIACRQP